MAGNLFSPANENPTTGFMNAIGSNSDFERTKLFWRGDRIEWLLARGFHDWFLAEIKAGRTLWPE